MRDVEQKWECVPIPKIGGLPEGIIAGPKGATVDIEFVTEDELELASVIGRGLCVDILRCVLVNEGESSFHDLARGIDTAQIETTVS